MTKLRKQIVVVEQPVIFPHQQVEEAALFNLDGTPYAGGSSGSFNSRENFEELSGDSSTTVAGPGGREYLLIDRWGDGEGEGVSLLLDLTDPIKPTVVMDGIYIVTCVVDILEELGSGDGVRVDLHLDADDLDALAVQSVARDQAYNGVTTVTLNCTCSIPAGGAIQVKVLSDDDIDHECQVQEIMIQRILV